jgi:single-stranded-DNA-specific exonuclease
MSTPFLNVSQSLRGRIWRDRLDLDAQGRAEAMVQLYGMPDILARVLAGRHVRPEAVELYLHPTLRDLMPDPNVMRDMDKAATCLAQAIEAGKTIAIFGDYDVDGACASACLAQFLAACGTPYVLHIPDRIFEGYGPNNEAITSLYKRGARVLVTVDCGTMSFEPLAHAKSLGMEVIVLDHHQAPEILPEVDALVNPNRQDDISGLGYLCAAGVVFMTLVALNRELREKGFWTNRLKMDLLILLDLVALATVADVVPLQGLNRAFVTRGLHIMHARERPGLRALFDVARADGPPRPYHLGFLIGPRINAGGRIGDAALGARLLLEQDEGEAQRIATELDRLNSERQAIEVATVEEAVAEAMASLGQHDEGSVIVTASDHWHPGVMGLVAARLKDRFQRPVFAIAFTGKNGSGSGRSLVGVDLGRAVRAAVDAGILIKGGGHAMAAGVTIERERLGDFRAFMESYLVQSVSAARENDVLLIDAALAPAAARAELVRDIEQAGPFGAGNPEPVFAFSSVRLVDVAEVGTGHVRFRAKSGDGSMLQGIAFRAAQDPLGQTLLRSRGENMHLAGTLSLDHWGGGERVQLRLIDAARVPPR